MAGHRPPERTSFEREEVTLDTGSVFAKLPIIGGLLAIVGLVATFVLGQNNPTQMYAAYTTSFMFWLSIAIGGMFFVAIYFATKSAWSLTVRRIAENAMSTLPVFILLFIPIFIGLNTVYHWTDPAAVAHSDALTWKKPYLNVTWFLIRAAFYLAVWTVFSVVYYRFSTKQDETGDVKYTHKMQWLSGPMVFLLAITVTFAGIDWVQSLAPHWFSTIFGVYFFAGCMISSLSFMIIVALCLRASNATSGAINEEHIHGLGQFLFGFMIFWTYVAFSQFFLIWYGNLPEETHWFAYRYVGGWKNVSLLLIAFHFIFPLFFLMPRYMKRAAWSLAIAASVMFVMQFVDAMWLVKPSVQHAHGVMGVNFGIVDIAAFVGIGGVFLAIFGYNMRKHALVPFRDPRLPESMSFLNM